MRKLIVFSSTGSCGSDGVDALLVPDGWTEEYIDSEVWQMALSNAESYGIYYAPDYEQSVNDGDMTQEEFDEMEDQGSLSSGIEGYYEEYNPEKHDMLRSGGGSFEDDFKVQ